MATTRSRHVAEGPAIAVTRSCRAGNGGDDGDDGHDTWGGGLGGLQPSPRNSWGNSAGCCGNVMLCFTDRCQRTYLMRMANFCDTLVFGRSCHRLQQRRYLCFSVPKCIGSTSERMYYSRNHWDLCNSSHCVGHGLEAKWLEACHWSWGPKSQAHDQSMRSITRGKLRN